MSLVLHDQDWIALGNLRPDFQNCSGFKFLTLNQSWILQRVQVREALKHGSNLQLLEIEQCFFFLIPTYWALWKIYLLTIAFSETDHQNFLFPCSDPFLNNSVLQSLLTSVARALFLLQYVTEAEGNLQRARALVDGMQKEKIELLNQLEEEKR